MKAIAAMSLNRVIGHAGRLPWHLPDDLRWFKRATMGQVILMGRKTFESVGRPLPGRLNLVVSRSRQFVQEGVETISDLDALAPEKYSPRQVWVTGGAEIFRQTLHRCDELYLSLVKREVEGDAFFPSFENEFEQIETLLETPEFEVRRYRRLP